MSTDQKQSIDQDPEKPSNSSQNGQSPHGSTSSEHQVENRYLTFETELPSLAVDSNPNGSSPPAPPDLKKYVDPMSWSSARKSVLIAISCIGTCFTAYTAGCYAPAVDQLTAEWSISRVAALIGITIFTFGFGIAPMVLAPFSEINGRRPVFVSTGVVFAACVVAQAGTRSFTGMLVARFLCGCASSTFSTMVGGVVADIYQAEQRNTPMALFTGFVLLGTGLGPLISGFIAQHTTWRWIFGVQSIVVALIVIAVFFFFDESRGSVLLSRKAKVLNAWYDECEKAGYGVQVMDDAEKPHLEIRRLRWLVKADEERLSLAKMIKISLFRPMLLLFTEPTVFFFSLWISFAWGVLYCMFSALPYIFETVYNFNLEQSNAVFASVSVASILATFLSIYQEKFAMKIGKLDSSPEGRLYFSCIESVFLPLGLFWLGWSAVASVPWIVPTLGIASATIGIFSVYLATFNYLADTYHRYASSAIAAQSFSRNLMGGSFPLFTEQMYRRLGIGGASSLLGGVAVLLTIVPWILALKGPQIRARSKFASEIMN